MQAMTTRWDAGWRAGTRVRARLALCLVASALGLLPAGAVAGPPGATPPAGDAAGASEEPADATTRAAPPANIVYPELPPARARGQAWPPPGPRARAARPRGASGPPGATAPGAYPASAPAMYREESYRSLALLADVAWIWATWRTEQPWLALAGYVGAAPLVHASQRNTRSAWISAGARAGALLLAVAMIEGACASDGYCDESIDDAVLLGLTGMGTVMVVDWLVLARKQVPVTPRPASTWAPRVSATPGGLQLGVAGAF